MQLILCSILTIGILPEDMNAQEIDELLCNVQIINDKTTELINFLLDKERLDFEQIKNVYRKLEIVCGKAVSSQVFIEIVLIRACPQCGQRNIAINWDDGMLECQNSECRYQWSAESNIN